MLSLEWGNMKKVGYYTRLIILCACVRVKRECSLICLRSEQIYQNWAVCFWFLTLWDLANARKNISKLTTFPFKTRGFLSFSSENHAIANWEGGKKEKPNNFKVCLEFISMNSSKRLAMRAGKFEKNMVKMVIWPALVLTKCEFWAGVFASSLDIYNFPYFKMYT